MSLLKNNMRGNALLLVLMAIVALALLSMAISQTSSEQSSVLPRQSQDDQINRMLTYASVLGGALQQMVINGEDQNTLYSSLSLLQPGQAGFETSPNNLKLFHPLGGGITYMSATSPDPTAVGTGFNINPNAIITGVGCSSGTGCIVSTVPATGHIVFGALISTAGYCQRINQIITSSTTVPVMTSGDFTTLFTTSTAVTIGGDCTPSCANTPRLCVSNTGATQWGFYSDLFPPQNFSSQ